MVNQKTSYCGDTIRAHDRDRFLLSLTAGPEKRSALWALFAFNYEIAKTREVVTEPQLGRIRLQWWREAVEGLYAGTVLEHEVVQALAAAIRDHALPQDLFMALIEAREFDLSGRVITTFTELEMYADRTATPLNKLAVKIAGEAEEDRVIRAVSIGYALTGLLRAAPFHAAQGRKFLPKGEKDAPAVAALAEKYFNSVAPAGRYLKACRVLSGSYLARMKKTGYRLADPALARPPLKFLIRLYLGRI